MISQQAIMTSIAAVITSTTTVFAQIPAKPDLPPENSSVFALVLAVVLLLGIGLGSFRSSNRVRQDDE